MENMSEEQALIAYIKLTGDEHGTAEEQDQLFKLQERLRQAVISSGVGECDGNALGDGFCTFYLYGKDADAIERVALPIVRELKIKKGSYYQKRYGDAFDENAREVEAPL